VTIGAAISGLFFDPPAASGTGVELEPAVGFSDPAAEGFGEGFDVAAPLSDPSDSLAGETDGLASFEDECLESALRWRLGVGLGRSPASSVNVFLTLPPNRLSE
jgi:hypothetical protein